MTQTQLLLAPQTEPSRVTALAIPESSVFGFAETVAEIFEPLEVETVADLLERYAGDEARALELASMFADLDEDTPNELKAVVQFFLDGNFTTERSSAVSGMAKRMFTIDGAIKAMRAHYWSRALALTDVYQSMPQKRRDEWDEQIREMTTPPFDSETVIPTLRGLLADREKFFAERVDGIFHVLSGDHVTNSPMGFSKRMIIAYIHNGMFIDCSRVGYVNDLRAVVARFMHRDEPRWRASNSVVKYAWEQETGQWVTVDGGALRVRVYLKGTIHIEVHPDMAWRLNEVLATLHPHAIPSKHRQRPKRRRDYEMIQRPLPFKVLGVIEDMRIDARCKTVEAQYQWSELDSNIRDEIGAVMEMLGGVVNNPDGPTRCVASRLRMPVWHFTYDPELTISALLASGCIPDTKSHQFYPTPLWLAKHVVEVAQIGAGMTVLEPSAGLGGLADLLPSSTVCVEISYLHCTALRAKGFEVYQADFISWVAEVEARRAAQQGQPRGFDRIVMNPPFDRGRWRAHLEHAATLLAPGGRLVSVLPAGAATASGLLDDWCLEWSERIPFPGTTIEVVVLIATPPTI